MKATSVHLPSSAVRRVVLEHGLDPPDQGDRKDGRLTKDDG
jgi:hypothetical protein